MGEPNIEQLWARFEGWLTDHAPPLLDQLRPPASDEVLAAAEQQMGRSLPDSLKRLLKLRDGGDRVIGGWDLMGAAAIAKTHGEFLEYCDDSPAPLWLRALSNKGRSDGWIPFVYTPGGDYVCIDLDPGPRGKVGQIFQWSHDDDPTVPVAESLESWLQLALAALERGDIRYHLERKEFVPAYRVLGFDLAFDDHTLRFDADEPEHQVRGPVEVAIWGLDGAQPLDGDSQLEVCEGGKTILSIKVGELPGEPGDHARIETDNMPTVQIKHSATVRFSPALGDGTIWVHMTKSHPDEARYLEAWQELEPMIRFGGAADAKQVAAVVHYGELLDGCDPSVLEKNLDFAARAVHVGSAFAPLLRAGAHQQVADTGRRLMSACARLGHTGPFNEFFVMNLLAAATQLDRASLEALVDAALRLPCAAHESVYFNAACCYAKLGRKDECLSYARLARAHGKQSAEFMAEPDFSDFHADLDFRRAVEQGQDTRRLFYSWVPALETLAGPGMTVPRLQAGTWKGGKGDGYNPSVARALFNLDGKLGYVIDSDEFRGIAICEPEALKRLADLPANTPLFPLKLFADSIVKPLCPGWFITNSAQLEAPVELATIR